MSSARVDRIVTRAKQLAWLTELGQVSKETIKLFSGPAGRGLDGGVFAQSPPGRRPWEQSGVSGLRTGRVTIATVTVVRGCVNVTSDGETRS